MDFDNNCIFRRWICELYFHGSQHAILDADGPQHLYIQVVSQLFGWSVDGPPNINYFAVSGELTKGTKSSLRTGITRESAGLRC